MSSLRSHRSQRGLDVRFDRVHPCPDRRREHDAGVRDAHRVDSRLDEVMALADRLLVMYGGGKIVAEIDPRR